MQSPTRKVPHQVTFTCCLSEASKGSPTSLLGSLWTSADPFNFALRSFLQKDVSGRRAERVLDVVPRYKERHVFNAEQFPA